MHSVSLIGLVLASAYSIAHRRRICTNSVVKATVSAVIQTNRIFGLSGADKSSKGFKTKVKAAYAKGLCVSLARIFGRSMQNAMLARKWKVMKSA